MQREFEAWPLLSQNVVYADTAGDIGWQLVGETPKRRSGYGTLPAPAAEEASGWEDGCVPAAEMPSVLNPAAGFVASANNQPVREGDGPYLGSDWMDGYRAGRISEALAGRDGWDVAATQALQLDVVSLPWREVREAVLELPESSEAVATALSLLRAWDGGMSIESPAAALFDGFLREMARRIAEARAPGAARWALGAGFTPLLGGTTFLGGRWSRVVRRLVEQPDGWFERGWPSEMADALASAVGDLRRRAGSDTAKWGWGHVRPLTLEHPLGQVKALAPVFNRGPFPWGGDGNTVSQAGARHRWWSRRCGR
jgi:penicillin amidase